MAQYFCVFRMGDGYEQPVEVIVADAWSPMLISDAEETGLYQRRSLYEQEHSESTETFRQRESKFCKLLRNVHADELSAEFERFLNTQYLRFHDTAIYMMSSGRWLAKDVKKLKIVPEKVFELFYEDSDENVFEGHLAAHKTELESFRLRASELGIHLQVYSRDALALRRLVSNLLKKARDLEAFEVDAIRDAVNASNAINVSISDAVHLFATLSNYSNFGRRVERRYLARKNKPMLLTNLFERFIDERKRSRDQSSIDKYTTSFSAFVRLLGSDIRLDEFFEASQDEPLAVRFKVALMKSGITEPRTVNGYLSNLKQFSEWAIPNCGLAYEKNPFDGLFLPLSRFANMVRRVFTNSEMQRILNYTPSYVLEAKDFREALYWVPKILAYTLMRPAEIVMLKTSNIKKSDHIYFIDLIDEHGKSTAASRKIPIHNKLIEYGFIDFVKSAGKNKQTYLFEELHREPVSSASDLAEKIGKSINRTCLKKLGIVAEEGRKVDLYCLRKTGISRLKYEGASGYIVRQLVGHGLKDDVTFGIYGGGTNTKLEALAAVINMLDYSDDSILDDDDGEPVVFE